MDQKKSPNRRSKRQSKLAEDSYWDCSVCTYRNTAEAFKCLMCDVRKGTSTRKPRINPQLVAQQVAQQYTQSIPKVKKEGMVPTVKSESGMGVGSPPTIGAGLKLDKKNGSATSDGKVTPITTTVIPVAVTTTPISTTTNFTAITTTATTTMPTVTPTTTSRKARPKLKNVDRSSAEHKAVTVNNVTVIITEFQPKRHISSSSENNHHPQHNHHPHHHHHHHQPPHYGPLTGGGGGGGGCDVGIMGTSHGNMNSHPTHNGCNGASGSMSSSSGVENGNHSDSTNCSSNSNDSQSEGRSS